MKDGGLPAAVGPDDGKYFISLNFKADIIDLFDAAKRNTQVFDFKMRHNGKSLPFFAISGGAIRPRLINSFMFSSKWQVRFSPNPAAKCSWNWDRT
jgi:hypothetical protein